MRRNISAVAIAGALALIASEAGAVNLVDNGDFDNVGGVWTDNTGDGSNDFQSPGGVAIPGWSNSVDSPTSFGSPRLTAIAVLLRVPETAAPISST